MDILKTAVTSVCVVFAASLMTVAAPAMAATCTAKCAEKEAECIKRTNNKGQCGKKAKECTGKCK